MGDTHLDKRISERVEESKVLRRSVTIRPTLDARVRDLMAACTRHKIDLNYTEALNLLAELGVAWLGESNREKRDARRVLWSQYLDYDQFKNSVMNDWLELEEFRQWKMIKARRDGGKGPSAKIKAAR